MTSYTIIEGLLHGIVFIFLFAYGPAIAVFAFLLIGTAITGASRIIQGVVMKKVFGVLAFLIVAPMPIYFAIAVALSSPPLEHLPKHLPQCERPFTLDSEAPFCSILFSEDDLTPIERQQLIDLEAKIVMRSRYGRP